MAPHSMSTYRIRPSRCRFARGRFSQWVTPASSPGHSGSLTISARRPGRPDVLAFVSDVLKTPMKISGQPVAHLVASTSGTDSDWVVKVIDVYPDEVAGQHRLGGYQLMVSADIFRGRYRESFEHAKALTPDTPLEYRFALPTANHVFLPGHRLMVQVQSSWFPLYDRNPQTFVPNIFWAKPGDYRKADAARVSRARPGQLRRTAGGHAVMADRSHHRQSTRPVLGFTGNLVATGIGVVRLADGKPVNFDIRATTIRPTTANLGRARWMPDGRIAYLGQDDKGVNGLFVQEFAAGRDTSTTRTKLAAV